MQNPGSLLGKVRMHGQTVRWAVREDSSIENTHDLARRVDSFYRDQQRFDGAFSSIPTPSKCRIFFHCQRSVKDVFTGPWSFKFYFWLKKCKRKGKLRAALVQFSYLVTRRHGRGQHDLHDRNKDSWELTARSGHFHLLKIDALSPKKYYII